MILYVYKHNGDKINEEIEMIRTDGEKIIKRNIGNIYNLVDYINYEVEDNSKVKFINFTGNKLEFIVKSITKYREVTKIDEYYSLIIGKTKTKIRGK